MHVPRFGETAASRRRMTPPFKADFAAGLIAQLPSLRRFARAMVGDSALADDLVQDGIERALVHADTLRDATYLGAWLRRIVNNLYMDELRRRRVRGVPVSTEDAEGEAALTTQAEAGASTGEVTRALGRLSVEHRHILVLAELNVPAGTVMSRLARARAALRRALEGETR
jgi:RNA polymerase sigma-70 factor (ECF subfamily)